MLQFVLGSSGSGKSEAVYKKIIHESLAHPEKQFFVLVPDQASLEAQKALVTLHPGKGITNIDALSFMRLAHRVFDETGVKKGIVLDDAGKTLIVRRVLTEKRNEIRYFTGNAEKRGFCEEMKSVLSELFQYGISEEKLAQMREAAAGKNVLSKKLTDIEIVYKGFNDFLKDRFITAEEIFELFAKACSESNLIKGSTVVLDGYTGFTPSQYCLLEALMKYCENVYVTIAMDASEAGKVQGEHELFYLSYKTMERLKKLAANVSCPVADNWLLPAAGGCPRFAANESMAELEKNMFRTGAKAFTKPCPIELRIAANPVSEVKALVCEIKKSLAEGLRYRDMAVITGDLENYAPILEREFAKADIPAFLDSKRSVMANPVVELLRAILELPETSYSYEGVFRVLKATLFDMDPDMVEELDNYVLATGIRGKSNWKKEWAKSWKKPHPPRLELVNRAREEFINRVSDTVAVLESKTATVKERVDALRAFMLSEEVEQRLGSLIEALEKQGEINDEIKAENALLIREYSQILGITEEILRRTEELLGNEVISEKDFRELIELGFSEARVGLLPQGMDRLMVGDVERSRISGIKRLFFIGVNEGIIPAAGNKGGIISDTDRLFFSELGIELSPTLREKAYTAEFYLYLNLSKPSMDIYISWCEKSSDEKTLLPSYLIAKLKNYYPDLKEKPAGKGDEAEYLLGSDMGFTALTNDLRSFRAEGKELPSEELINLAALVPCSNEEKEALLASVFYKSPEKQLREETAIKLYGDKLRGSISRLEEYAKCNLRFYLNAGLGLSNRREYEISLPDIGTVFHNAMEYCSKKLREENKKFTELTDEECKSLSVESATIAAEEYDNGLLLSSKRTAYLLERIKSVVERTLKTTRFQLTGSRFEPAFFEEKFSYNLENLELTGCMDRVDICKEDGHCFSKVVDYKTGSTTLSMSNLYAGLQLQLGVYLGASLKLLAEKYPEYKAVPAGIFYYHLVNPFVESSDDPELAKNKELKPDGLANSDKWIIRMLDGAFSPEGVPLEEQKLEKDFIKPSVTSVKIPVNTTKDAVIGGKSKVASSTGFEQIVDYLDGVMEGYAKEILAGKADANPVITGGNSSCSNCDYRDICSFGAIGGKKDRIIKEMEAEEVWQLLGQQIRNQ